jgi:peptide deformylase
MPRVGRQGKSMSIRTYGDPVLRRAAEPVETIDSETIRLCERMVEEMIRADGVGLAAPQIGVSKRIIVLDVDGEFHVLINPELIETSDETEAFTEGCLSVPGVHADVFRSSSATVEGTALDGTPVRIRGEGVLARAIQHEMDHLNGHLFVDHLSPVRRQGLLKEYERKRRETSG